MKRITLIVILAFITILFIILISSCEFPKQKIHTVEMVYTTGEKDTITTISRISEPYLSDKGCVFTGQEYICGVRSLKVLTTEDYE